MKINKWFKGEIMKRFLSQVELEEFQQHYEEAKKLAVADRALTTWSYTSHASFNKLSDKDE